MAEPTTGRRPSKPTAFGLLLKDHLYERGLTQTWLAQAVGIASASLSRALHGRRQPSAALILAISAALGLLPDEEKQLLSAAGYGAAGELTAPAVAPAEGSATPAPEGSRRQRGRGLRFGGVPVALDGRTALLQVLLRQSEELQRRMDELHQTVEALLRSEEEAR